MFTDLRSARYAFVDVETTGFDPRTDRVVEIACIVTDGFRERARLATLVDPERPIPAGASAIHHITARHVARQPRFADVLPRLEALTRDAVIVAHNAPFDVSFLPPLAGRPRICTLRFARHVLRGVDNYANQTLRYALGIDDPSLEGELPHRAAGDALVTLRVFERLVAVSRASGFAHDVETLIERIAAPAEVERFWFGKHRGRPLVEIPRDYLEYVARSFADNPDARHSARLELARRTRPARAALPGSCGEGGR